MGYYTFSWSLVRPRSCLRLTSIPALILNPSGLDIIIERGTVSTSGVPSTCGVLTCKQDINSSVSFTLDKDETGSEIVLSSILSMSLFIRESAGKPGVEIGSITSASPSLIRVADGKTVSGLLKPSQGRLQVELVKQRDCQAQFSCRVRGLDSQGREVTSSADLVQESNRFLDAMPANSPTSVASIQKLISQAVDSLENKMEDLTNKTELLENRIVDEISLLQKDLTNKSSYLEGRMTSMENSLDGFLMTVKNGTQVVLMAGDICPQPLKYDTNDLDNALQVSVRKH
ncbi:hypothetical protein ElyMa_004354100 [Elysia marginata]|uniref:Uncharacterized protein n=1 Tax=Elysia marginata TaxID=1093978 RepID=A0AAV4H6U1_9GAST|nr:hypothetical protein ElyMa_004354100 [Elysia marginata]